SGDWFNRLDWTCTDNHFGTGVPPGADNGKDYALLKPVLADERIKPAPDDIAWMRDAFRDLLRIRASSTLFRLRTADDIERRLRLLPATTGDGTVVGAHIDGRGYPGAGFDEVPYLVNADIAAHEVALPDERGKRYVLHPVQRAVAVDRRPAEQARYDAGTGTFEVPARSVVVYVVERGNGPTTSLPSTGKPVTDTLLLPAPGVSDAPLQVHVHLPAGYDARDARRYPVLYVNDGQDWEAVGFADTLAQLYRDNAITPIIVVAIDMPRDRMGAYGLSDRSAGRSLVGDTRYGPV